MLASLFSLHTPERRNISDRDYLDMHGYRRRRTDAAGRVLPAVDIQSIEGGLNGNYNPKSDRVTGKTYLFRIEHATILNAFSVKMQPGVESRGRHFAVDIEEIGEARKRNDEEMRRSKITG